MLFIAVPRCPGYFQGLHICLLAIQLAKMVEFSPTQSASASFPFSISTLPWQEQVITAVTRPIQ
jgi:hypothetical protein